MVSSGADILGLRLKRLDRGGSRFLGAGSQVFVSSAVVLNPWAVTPFVVGNGPFTGVTQETQKAQIFTLQIITVAKL